MDVLDGETLDLVIVLKSQKQTSEFIVFNSVAKVQALEVHKLVKKHIIRAFVRKTASQSQFPEVLTTQEHVTFNNRRNTEGFQVLCLP